MRKSVSLFLLSGLTVCTAFAQEKQVKLPLELLLNREGTVEIPANLNAVVETRGWDLYLRTDGSPAFSRSAQSFHHRQLQQSATSDARSFSNNPDDAHWDGQFSLRGTNGSVFVLKSHLDKVYIGGLFTTVGKTPARNIAMWDGANWHSLGSGAENGVNADVQAIEADGADIYVAGSFSKAGSIAANKVARWDGNNWHSLGTGTQNGVDGFYVNAIALKAPGQLYVGGNISAAGGVPAKNLAFWDGTSWSQVGGGTNGTIWSMKYFDNKLFVGGGFDSAGTAPLKGLGYLEGGAWHAMGGVNDWVLSIEPGALDEILIGGFFDTVDGQFLPHVARYSISNQTWQPLGTGVGNDNGTDGPVRDILYNNDTYYLAGDFDNAGSVAANNVAIYNFGKFQPIGLGVDNVVRGMGFDNMGKLVLGGSFMTAGDSVSYGLAKVDFDPLDMTSPPVWRALTPGKHNGSDGIISKAIVAGGELYVCGTFGWLGTEKHNNVAKWDGSKWVALADGIGGFVNDIIWYNNQLYAGGYFAVQQGTVYSPLIARWDGDEWLAVGQGIGGSVASQVTSLETDGANLYVAGYELSQAANANGTVINIGNIARWDGKQWHPLGNGIEMNGMGIVKALKWHNSYLYAAGFFSQAGGQKVTNIARWDGQNWHAVGSGIDGMVYALASDNDKLYAGGEFITAGSVTVNNLAQWDGSAWSMVGNGISLSNGNAYNLPYVSAIYPHAGGLYVGGYFDQAGNQVATGAAFWNGTDWQSLGSGPGDGAVHSFSVYDNKLVTTGTFYVLGGGASAVSLYNNLVADTKDKVQAFNGFRCYPNPGAGSVHVLVPGNQQVQFTIVDITGRTRRSVTLPAGDQQIDISDLSTGMYQLRIQAGDQVAVQKLVVAE